MDSQHNTSFMSTVIGTVKYHLLYLLQKYLFQTFECGVWQYKLTFLIIHFYYYLLSIIANPKFIDKIRSKEFRLQFANKQAQRV